MTKLVVKLGNNMPVVEVGGKGYSLGILIENGFNVPKGFVITSEAFFEYLKQNNLMEKIEKLSSEININNFQEKSKEIKNLILSGKIPKEMTSEIAKNLKRLNAKYVSIRSSTITEDSLKASFAGLHDTFLNIKSDANLVLNYMKRVWASLFSERATAYRVRKDIPHLEGMAVVIQEMTPAEVSGITFTVHPSDEKTLLVEASYGIGDMIVSGKVDPDGFVVDRESLTMVKKRIGDKSKMSICESEEVKVIEVKNELAKRQVMPDEKIREIANTSLKVEKIFNYPQDIEWCVSNDKLWLLQSRPITGVIR